MIESKITAEEKAEFLIGLFEKHGHEAYIGEAVSQVEHAVQCAWQAAAANADDEMVIAAFLHDVGHLLEMAGLAEGVEHMDAYGVADHDELGGEMLRQMGLSERVACLVASHVQAKRYLTATDEAYYEQLSEASRQTLVHQGGPMDAAEIKAFESDPLFPDFIQLRHWDELSKEIDLPMTGSLEEFKSLIIEHLKSQKIVHE
jgi:2-amino-1-hydroxyethylphosphonate dioxygenase (glycine-forming)